LRSVQNQTLDRRITYLTGTLVSIIMNTDFPCKMFILSHLAYAFIIMCVL